VWQCGTIQLDFSIPERLGATYIDKDNTKKVPVMLHRAVLGSVERFLGILIEEYAGLLPLWLCPTQVVVANIATSQEIYAQAVVDKLRTVGVRVDADVRNENIGYKIRAHSIARIPYTLICGDKEMAAGAVSVRDQSGKSIGVMSVDDFISLIQEKIVAGK
jgi:threonyl-tRNA synthetase